MNFFFIDTAIVRPRLEKLYLDRIDQVRAFLGRTLHDLVTLSCLATWGLGLVPTAENLDHEETTRRSKYRPFFFSYFFLIYILFLFIFIIIILLDLPRCRNDYNEGEQGKNHN